MFVGLPLQCRANHHCEIFLNPTHYHGVSNKKKPVTKTPAKTFDKWPEKMKPHSKLSKIELRKK